MPAKARKCAGCATPRPRGSFRAAEWRQGSRPGRPDDTFCRRCEHRTAPGAALEEWEAPLVEVTESALRTPFAEGGFKAAARGIYGEDGGACVVKWFKDPRYAVLENVLYRDDFRVLDCTLMLADRWNATRPRRTKPLRVNVPELDMIPRGPLAGRPMVHEPLLSPWKKWNSNSGWMDNATATGRMMQAVSHFSYHTSRGQYVLCDLQGAEDEDEVRLSDPAVLSRRCQFGYTDLGVEGILNFFAHHICNEYCSDAWQRPRAVTAIMTPMQGTRLSDVLFSIQPPHTRVRVIPDLPSVAEEDDSDAGGEGVAPRVRVSSRAARRDPSTTEANSRNPSDSVAAQARRVQVGPVRVVPVETNAHGPPDFISFQARSLGVGTIHTVPYGSALAAAELTELAEQAGEESDSWVDVDDY